MEVYKIPHICKKNLARKEGRKESKLIFKKRI